MLVTFLRFYEFAPNLRPDGRGPRLPLCIAQRVICGQKSTLLPDAYDIGTRSLLLDNNAAALYETRVR